MDDVIRSSSSEMIGSLRSFCYAVFVIGVSSLLLSCANLSPSENGVTNPIHISRSDQDPYTNQQFLENIRRSTLSESLLNYSFYTEDSILEFIGPGYNIRKNLPIRQAGVRFGFDTLTSGPVSDREQIRSAVHPLPCLIRGDFYYYPSESTAQFVADVRGQLPISLVVKIFGDKYFTTPAMPRLYTDGVSEELPPATNALGNLWVAYAFGGPNVKFRTDAAGNVVSIMIIEKNAA
ncbi:MULTISPECIES: hypothetical protein [Cupriavidus]|uniref:hypothetical protein n=1 Tax=Cupriavidus TaxID=106589 RepID=UPI0012671F0E|nr:MULTISPECIES: hypothetical protein [Cupriavidus]